MIICFYIIFIISICYIYIFKIYRIGSESVINGEKPNYVVPFSDMDLDEKVDAIFEWLELPAKDRPSFISVYIPDLDTIGHKHGPSSSDITRALADIDRMFEKFISKLDDSQLINFIDIMVVCIINTYIFIMYKYMSGVYCINIINIYILNH